MLRSVAASAEVSRKELLEELSGLRPLLSSKLKATSLEKAKFVKDFLPSVVKKLFESDHFNQALDVQDYHPKAEKLFDEAAAAFYKLEFPYISLLSGKASQSLKELSIVEAPSI
ncbi:hypothetical protein Tco_1057048 [Tanacetum coccineum]|uniref:Uncharacterized protein n=1 Tax=Tanacetum coccineum TaxID=301880 RepID=A0ABQ5H5A1_9ASTR